MRVRTHANLGTIFIKINKTSQEMSHAMLYPRRSIPITCLYTTLKKKRVQGLWVADGETYNWTHSVHNSMFTYPNRCQINEPHSSKSFDSTYCCFVNWLTTRIILSANEWIAWEMTRNGSSSSDEWNTRMPWLYPALLTELETTSQTFLVCMLSLGQTHSSWVASP